MTAPRNRVLTEEQVMEIRRDYLMTSLRDFARRYGVTHPTIHSALHGTTFQHLPGAVPLGVTPHSGGRLSKISHEKILETLALRNSCPELWTYRRLADRLNRELRTRYGPTNVMRILARASGEVAARPVMPKKERVSKPRVRKPSQAKRNHVSAVFLPRDARVVDISSKTARSEAAARFMARYRSTENEERI